MARHCCTTAAVWVFALLWVDLAVAGPPSSTRRSASGSRRSKSADSSKAKLISGSSSKSTSSSLAAPSKSSDDDLSDFYSIPRTDCASFTDEHVMYTVNRIMQVRVVDLPFPHFHLRKVFHPEVYACMLANLPKTQEIYRKLEQQSERYTVSLREIVNGTLLQGPWMNERKKIWNQIPEDSPHINVPFWTMWAETFSRVEISHAYLFKMARTLALRPEVKHRHSRSNHDPNVIANELSKELHWNMALNRDLAGYRINPHTDADRKHVTVLYYLPAFDSTVPKDAGTCVMKSTSRPPRIQRRGSTRRNPDAFKMIEQAKFVPNSVFVFAACDASWHSVPFVTGTFQRDTIQAFLNDETDQMVKGRCPTEKDL